MNRPALITIALLIITIFSLTISVTAESDELNDRADLSAHYQQAKFFYNQLKTKSTHGDSRDNWLKGVQNFRRIYLAEPKSDLAPACLFMLGRLYYDMYEKFGKGIDLGESISYYRDVDSLFPNHRLADDALFTVGMILLNEINDPKRAAAAFGKIVSDYQEGDMHSQAETKLKILSKDFDIPLPAVMIGNSQLTKLSNVLPVKYWSSDDYTRVVIKTSGPVTYREELLEEVGNQPRRLYIDFQDSYIEPRFRSPIPIEDGLLKRIRTGQYSADTVRVVLDIESISSYKIFSLPDPFRVVIDVRGQEHHPVAAAPSPANQPAPRIIPKREIGMAAVQPAATSPSRPAENQLPESAGPEAEAAVPAAEDVAQTGAAEAKDESPDADSIVVLEDHKKKPITARSAARNTTADGVPAAIGTGRISLAQQLGLGVGKIVIDPGHGGKDPGALAFGLKEKDIVLQVAKKLAEHLRRDLEAEVILTREGDVFLPLEERTAIANTNDADLFVSLHINAHPSPRVKGFETYFLNLSTNDEAMRVAARENATSTHQMSDLQDILSDIMKNSKINESSRLAQQVHSSIESGLTPAPYTLKNMGVKQAPFYVLIGAEMPAILIELAFISNPDDARLLADQLFIDRVTAEISKGIRGYVNTNTAQL